jgi:hypothetical protein
MLYRRSRSPGEPHMFEHPGVAAEHGNRPSAQFALTRQADFSALDPSP